MSQPQPVIAVHDAAFGYRGRTVVDRLTFEVRPGEVVAVLGPNGAGKSTVVKGLLGLIDHLGGSFELFGEPADSFSDRTRLGYVPQRHTLSASVRATVREVVEVGRLPHRKWWQRASAHDRELVDTALARVGLKDRADIDVGELSGGQQRRTLIARALAAEPDILIMDEPTAGVDLASQEVLAEVLARLAHQGSTLVIVTHELDALRGIVSRIIEISHNSVSFDGTPEQWAERQSRRIHAASSSAHHADDDHGGHEANAGPLDSLSRARRGV